MKKVLFALDQIYPGRNRFNYTLQFCQRMKTELFILQVINPKQYLGLLKSLQKNLSKAHNFFEDSIAAGALAEAGAESLARQYLKEGYKQLENLLTLSEQAGIKTGMQQRIGAPDKEIYRCIEKDQGIILTFYDPGDKKNITRAKQRQHVLQKKVLMDLGVPLVILLESQV